MEEEKEQKKQEKFRLKVTWREAKLPFALCIRIHMKNALNEHAGALKGIMNAGALDERFCERTLKENLRTREQ